MKGHKSRKLLAMLAAYKGEARLNATEAARLAGYSFPEVVGSRVRRRYKELFDEAEAEIRDNLIMKGEELDQRITSLARNTAHRDHYKALELLARMHGKLSDKVNVTIERPALNAQLDELIRQMAISRAVHIGVEVTAEDALLPIETGDQEQPAQGKKPA